ncbi:sulfite exporter TauE/SafE family protein [Sphingobacterium lumbrici]|uniref:sulfite exporter TauE/SafE family protein n=1 Tax=Sphingobacterium lumbrici TaxID=2559600 RepID=UPI00112A8809|nr:sulfite exporter TauE/SafE family protein [Sphingobacterium lumbrici]
MFDEALALLPDTSSWVLYFTCALLIGMSKTGIQNIGSLAVPLFAILFGAKYSTGIVLILLALADLMGVIYYRKQLVWAEVLKLLPMALIGLTAALIIGKYIDDTAFKITMGACIILGIGIMLWMEKLGKTKQLTITNGKWYSPLFGFIIGFSTMIGNVAGPAVSVYLLTKNLNKYALVATGAWFIMILNYIKIPLQFFVWQNISWAGVLLNFIALPFIVLGGVLGIKLVKILPEKEFRITITCMVIISCVLMILI